jgi:Uma2 family endonuclease
MTAVLPDSITRAVEILDRRLTGAEYESLPENPRLELVDGVLHLMTPPTGLHQDVVEAMKARLRTLCPRELRVVREQELRLGDVHRRSPDLMVIRAAAYDPHGYSYQPPDVLLIVEVVSPGTQTTDRIHKPGEYQRAKISHFWRVEPQPVLTIFTYQLGETGRYLETGVFTVGDTTAVPGLPWAKLAVADLDPD